MLSAVVTAKAQENCGFPGVAPGRVCPVTAHPGQTSAISPTECRICRSGCVHPDTVDSARHLSQASCDKTPSPRLQIMPYFQGCFVHLRCIYVAKLLATYLARACPSVGFAQRPQKRLHLICACATADVNRLPRGSRIDRAKQHTLGVLAGDGPLGLRADRRPHRP